MSGSYFDGALYEFTGLDHFFISPSCDAPYGITGTNPLPSHDTPRRDSIDYDALWEHMYVHAKEVIIPCKYCSSGNAISNPTCVRCGAPMGQLGE